MSVAETLLAALLLDDENLLRVCEQEPYQGSGPGGQNRNRSYSALRLTHRETGVYASASDHREGARNRAAALERLRLELALQWGRELARLAPAERAEAASTELPFRAGAALSHPDFSRSVARALAAFLQADLQPAGAARALGVSPSALVRFFKRHKRVRDLIWSWRASAGLPPLR